MALLALAGPIGDSQSLRLDAGVGHYRAIDSARFTKDEKRVFTRGEDGVRLWDLATGRCLLRFGRPHDSVQKSDVSPDESLLVTASLERYAVLWDVRRGTEVANLGGFKDNVRQVRFTPSGDGVIVAGWDGTVLLFDLKGKVLKRFETGQPVSSMDVSPDSRRLLTGGSGGAATLWDLGTGDRLKALSGHEKGVTTAHFSRDGSMAVTGGYDGTAIVWACATGVQLQRLKFESWVQSVRFSPKGNRVLVSTLKHGASLCDVKQGARTALASDGQQLAGGEFSSDGSKVVVFGEKSVEVFSVDSGRRLGAHQGHGRWVYDAVFSQDGRRVLSAGFDQTARVFSLANGKGVTALGGLADGLESVSVDVQGGRIEVTDRKLMRNSWDLSAGRVISRKPGLLGPTGANPIRSPDGRLQLRFGNRLEDPRDASLIRKLEGHTDFIPESKFSADSSFVVTCSWDGTTRVWDVATGRELCALISYRDGTWAVVDPSGRYDSSNGGHNANLCWIYHDPSRNLLETFDIEQFASVFYTPGLLARIIGREVLSPVPALQAPPLFPTVADVALDRRNRTLRFRLQDRGGGIGQVRILINGQEVAEVAAKPGPNSVKLSVAPAPDARLEVVAFNADNSLSSPRSGATNARPEGRPTTPTRYVAVIAGINDYRGKGLAKLRFATADAEAIVQSVRTLVAGLKLKPEIYWITDDPAAKGRVSEGTTVLPATKESFREVFEKSIPGGGAWRASDVMVLFLAGHGSSFTVGNRKHYAYLLQDAPSADMALPEIRLRTAVTDDDLVAWMARFLGGKKAMVFDTCAAGAAAETLEAVRSQDADLDRKQAVHETERRTGMRVLFGCPSDLASYESPEYGHGLLTWSLLSCLANEQLGSAQNRDMVLVETWFGRAAEMTQAESGAQRALSFGRGENFPLGYLDENGRRAIPFTSRSPLIGEVTLLNRDSGEDDLHVRQGLLDALSGSSRGGDRPPFRLAPASPKAIRLSGLYSLQGGEATLTLNVFPPGKPKEVLEVKALSTDLVKAVLDALKVWASRH